MTATAMDGFDRAVEGVYYRTEQKAERALREATLFGGVARAVQQLPSGEWAAIVVLTRTEAHWADQYRGRGVHVLVPREERP